jgi:hypothetical protein
VRDFKELLFVTVVDCKLSCEVVLVDDCDLKEEEFLENEVDKVEM